MSTESRHTADSITDDALDALYGQRDVAEAAVARVLAWCDQLDARARELVHDPDVEHPVAANVRHQLAQPEENSTP